MNPNLEGYRYAPFYCEENVWHLVQHPDFRALRRCVVFISNPEQQCAVWNQRAAESSGPIVWDYHVVLAVGGVGPEGRRGVDIVDLDCTAGVRLSLDAWLGASFPPGLRVPAIFRPWFRVVNGEVFVGRFGSDRRHMRTEAGWRAEPPDWPPIGSGFNLPEFIDMKERSGSVVSSARLVEALRHVLWPEESDDHDAR